MEFENQPRLKNVTLNLILTCNISMHKFNLQLYIVESSRIRDMIDE